MTKYFDEDMFGHDMAVTRSEDTMLVITDTYKGKGKNEITVCFENECLYMYCYSRVEYSNYLQDLEDFEKLIEKYEKGIITGEKIENILDKTYDYNIEWYNTYPQIEE